MKLNPVTAHQINVLSSILLLCFVALGDVQGQELKMRPLAELINTEEPGWELIETWMKDAKNEIKILERDSLKALSALYRTQVSTRSPMGAIIYETGGILVDHGWLRILGSGAEGMKRDLPDWNKGKSFEKYGQVMPFLLIADDVVGGFFALNGGAFGNEDLGKIYYLSPQSVQWEALDIGYSEFIHWAFTGDLNLLYEELRWKGWKEDLKTMTGEEAMSFYPFLFTKYKNIEDLSRHIVPVQEIWDFYTKK